VNPPELISVLLHWTSLNSNRIRHESWPHPNGNILRWVIKNTAMGFSQKKEYCDGGREREGGERKVHDLRKGMTSIYCFIFIFLDSLTFCWVRAQLERNKRTADGPRVHRPSDLHTAQPQAGIQPEKWKQTKPDPYPIQAVEFPDSTADILRNPSSPYPLLPPLSLQYPEFDCARHGSHSRTSSSHERSSRAGPEHVSHQR
jgi:hypothetical protein